MAAVWKKRGPIFCAEGQFDWMQTHAGNPVAEPLDGSIHRIYFSARDAQRRSSIAFVDIDLQAPHRILAISEKPVVRYGLQGTFDDSGASMGCLLHLENGDRYLYYLGWNLGVTVPWRNSIGLAKAKKGSSTFEKVSLAPLLDRHPVDPFSISYPWVLQENGGFRMWYGSNLQWGSTQESMAHVLKYAESADGLSWIRNGVVAVDFKQSGEYALSKPCVIREGSLYKMWYSYRGAAYRIGYAESEDGIHWHRLDEQVGITVSDAGWDSETVEYANVFDYDGQRFMLYNGNGYGKTGFGLAVLES
jgi:hypothetical protein